MGTIFGTIFWMILGWISRTLLGTISGTLLGTLSGTIFCDDFFAFPFQKIVTHVWLYCFSRRTRAFTFLGRRVDLFFKQTYPQQLLWAVYSVQWSIHSGLLRPKQHGVSQTLLFTPGSLFPIYKKQANYEEFTTIVFVAIFGKFGHWATTKITRFCYNRWVEFIISARKRG